jgi:hypothetical protein
MIFTDFLGIIIFTPVFVFVSLYGVMAVYRIFDNNI